MLYLLDALPANTAFDTSSPLSLARQEHGRDRRCHLKRRGALKSSCRIMGGAKATPKKKGRKATSGTSRLRALEAKWAVSP